MHLTAASRGACGCCFAAFHANGCSTLQPRIIAATLALGPFPASSVFAQWLDPQEVEPLTCGFEHAAAGGFGGEVVRQRTHFDNRAMQQR